MEDIKRIVARNITELRQSKGMTQMELAEKLNVTPQTISRWETETAYPDITAIPVLANIFDVSIDELMGYDKAKSAQMVNEIIDSSKKYFWNDIVSHFCKIIYYKLNRFNSSNWRIK